MKSEFQQFHGKAVRPQCFFRVCHCLYPEDSLLFRGLDPEGTHDGLLKELCWDAGSSMADFAFSSERKSRIHLSSIHPLSQSVDLLRISKRSQARLASDRLGLTNYFVVVFSWEDSTVIVRINQSINRSIFTSSVARTTRGIV